MCFLINNQLISLSVGIAASITTFSTWMEEGYVAFANFDNNRRGGLYDVCPTEAVYACCYTYN